MWIDSKSSNEVMGKLFNAKLRVEATQSVTYLLFADDSWLIIANNVKAEKGNLCKVGATKEINMENLGTHTLRLSTLLLV